MQALKTVGMGLRIVRYFCSLGSNRNYLLLTNQLTVLNTLLSCLLGKEERKVGLECLTILNELLGSSIRGNVRSYSFSLSRSNRFDNIGATLLFSTVEEDKDQFRIMCM